jgi:hypothetical protein
MVIEQKELNKQKVTGKVVPLENSEPCCLPGCCNNNSGGK